MRQVPYYLLVGDGRVSRHFQHYFSLLSLDFHVWHRRQPIARLHHLLPVVNRILVLISDDEIDPFITQHLSTASSIIIHCSGSLESKHAFGAHPLMTFGEAMYSLHQYMSIPFIIDSDAPSIAELFPGLSNPCVHLAVEHKSRYHALCVLAGNFSCLLWQKLFADFNSKLAIAPSMAHPYLKQCMQNILANPKTALTGPLVRGDQQTILANLAALQGDPIQEVYQSFVNWYQQTHSMKEIP
jgi:predicted short-subunit dehydrogenase-like oxidoreductase (DUF2520 family)